MFHAKHPTPAAALGDREHAACARSSGRLCRRLHLLRNGQHLVVPVASRRLRCCEPPDARLELNNASVLQV
jgi:hypothetical protein